MKALGNNPELILSYNAPTLIVVSGNKDAASPKTDCCAAIENMLLAAESLHIGSVWIGAMKYYLEMPDEMRKLGIPENYEAYYCVALGYKANTAAVKAPARKANSVNYIE